jgi:hypothetical protein
MLTAVEKRMIETLWQEPGFMEMLTDIQQYSKGVCRLSQYNLPPLLKHLDLPHQVGKANPQMDELMERCPILRSSTGAKMIAKVEFIADFMAEKLGRKPTVKDLIRSCEKGFGEVDEADEELTSAVQTALERKLGPFMQLFMKAPKVLKDDDDLEVFVKKSRRGSVASAKSQKKEEEKTDDE